MKRVLFAITFLCLALLGCQKSDYEYDETPQSNLDALWELIDQRYCFLTYKEKELGINWQQMHACPGCSCLKCFARCFQS